MNQVPIKTIVLSGAVLKGTFFLGCIQCLKERGMLASVDTYVGASSGSIICFLMVLGYDPQDALALCEKQLSLYSQKSIDIDDILGIVNSLGLDNGEDVLSWFSSCVSSKFDGQCDVTFMELAKRTGKNLIICASDITSGEVKYFSLDDTPEASVITAVRASIAVPYLFTPVNFQEHLLVDAGLFNNFPIENMRNSIFKDTLGIEIEGKPYEPKEVNILSYSCLLMNSILLRMNLKNDLESLHKNVVIWRFCDKKEGFLSIDPSTFKLDVKQGVLRSYYDLGYAFACDKLDGCGCNEID